MKMAFGALSVTILLALLLAVASTGDERGIESQFIDSSAAKTDLLVPSFAACTLNHTTTTALGYWSGYEQGMRTISYFDPADFCGSPQYPFEITDLAFVLWDNGGYQWPVTVDIVTYGLANSGDSCDGPGAELCRTTVSCDSATFAFPNVGSVSLSSACCVDGPFFIGLEYNDAGPGPYPSVVFDTSTAPQCVNWMYWSDDNWYEWYSFWGPPYPGYPMFWVFGETESAECGAVSEAKINEFRAYPHNAPQDADHYQYAFVELYNPGPGLADLTGHTLRNDAGATLASLPSVSLPGDSYFRVYFGIGSDELDLSDQYGEHYTNGDSTVFNSGEDGVGLYDGLGTVYDAVLWSTTGNAPTGVLMSDAATAGIWTASDFVFVSPVYSSFSTFGLCPDGIDHDVSSDWREFGWGQYMYAGVYDNPIQIYPANGQALEDTLETLIWGTVAYADSYFVELDADSLFGAPVVAENTTDTSLVLTGPVPEGVYFWRVRVYVGTTLIQQSVRFTTIIFGGLSIAIPDKSAPVDTVELNVGRLIQHKDTELLCIWSNDTSSADGQAEFRPGCNETGNINGPWDAAHLQTQAHVPACNHCSFYCTRAAIAMINNFYGGDLSQDRISYELNFDLHSGVPEGDLGHFRGTAMGSSGGNHGIGQRWQIYEWAMGVNINRSVGKPPLATIKTEIDAGRPIYIDWTHHAVVLDGYREVDFGFFTLDAVHIEDPWPGNGGWFWYGAWTPRNAGWDSIGAVNDGYFLLPAAGINARDDEATVSNDDDSDGIMDFDEGLPGYPNDRPRRFHAKFNEADSDSDEVNDKPEIRNYTFHDVAGYHPNHDNEDLGFPDLDNDNLRAEHDCDSDNDSDFDGGEDINGDGHNPIPAPGDLCETETCQFVDTEFCITVHTEKDTYLLGEPVHIVDIHGSRETHTYHSSSTYNYELGPGCVDKADGDPINWDGSFTTNAMGHANKKKVMTCLFPGEYYLYVDVLSDHNNSEPDNVDPWDCWTCEFDWYHGWHPQYDWPYHNPDYEWPFFEYPQICEQDISTSQIEYEILTPWWWWCYTWPAIPTDHYIGIGISRLAYESGALVPGSATPFLPEFVLQDDSCSTIPSIEFEQSTEVTELLESTMGDRQSNFAMFGFRIQNYQPPESLTTTAVHLIGNIPEGKSTDVTVPVFIVTGTAEYGWSPTFYDSIMIDIGDLGYICGDADASGGVDIDDVVHLITYIFAGGPAPVPLMAGDANCSGGVDIDDVVYLISYIFSGGNPPCDTDGNGVPDC